MKSQLAPAMLLVGVIALLLWPGAPFSPQAGGAFEPPSAEHWFGTDDLGRDLFTGVLEGARLSLTVGVGTALLAVALGAFVGVGAGYAGSFVDEAAMRVVELFQVVPRFFLALVVLTIWSYDVWLLVLVLGATSWSGLARLARAETLSIKEQEFVISARASGAGTAQLLLRHVLPQAMRPLVAAAPLVASAAMLTEAGLSFLGLSTLERVSWGYLLQNAQPFLRDAWWMSVFPGFAMTSAVLALALLSLLGPGDVASRLRAIQNVRIGSA